MLQKMSLEGRTAIVTGAGRGIGREMALALAEAVTVRVDLSPAGSVSHIRGIRGTGIGSS